MLGRYCEGVYEASNWYISNLAHGAALAAFAESYNEQYAYANKCVACMMGTS